jgi:hypothetical protein
MKEDGSSVIRRSSVLSLCLSSDLSFLFFSREEERRGGVASGRRAGRARNATHPKRARRPLWRFEPGFWFLVSGFLEVGG